MAEISERSDDMEFEGEEDPGEGGLVQYNPIGEYYGGRNDKNERHGRGRAVLPNGDLYLGCYFRGKRYGLGVYRYKKGNGARYGGDWVNGEKHGWGTMYFPDGSQYTGSWYKGHIHGWGVYVYSNGDEYEGWFFLGTKNGRGIYRTKATNEKFVGSWLLGLKHGPGMLIRPEYRIIGNWYNDVPRGSGVFVFEDLGVEQHGRFSIVKLLQPEQSMAKYKGLGHQIISMRSAPPPMDPVELERNTRIALEMSEMYREEGGEGDAGEGYPYFSSGNPSNKEDKNTPPSSTDAKNTQNDNDAQPSQKNKVTVPGNSKGAENPVDQGKIDAEKKIALANAEQERDKKVLQKMKEFIGGEEETLENNQVQVALVWRAMQITRLVTKYPDETVPPPPIPETPVPEIETSGEDDLDSSGMKKSSLDEDEAIRQAKLLAKTHTLGEIYTGSGVCQLPLAKIRWPDDFVPPRTFSKITVSTIEEFKNVVESIAPQLEPLDIQAIIAENLNVFRGHGINVSDKWKECLGNETECENVEMKGPPPPKERGNSRDEEREKRKSSNATDPDGRRGSKSPYPVEDGGQDRRSADSGRKYGSGGEQQGMNDEGEKYDDYEEDYYDRDDVEEEENY